MCDYVVVWCRMSLKIGNKMNIFLGVVMFPILGLLAYSQNDYILTVERFIVVNFNKDYFYLLKTHNFKFNRTHFGINFTFNMKENFGSELKIQVQAYKFASNEYRLFPIRLIFDVCDSIAKDEIGLQNLYSCGNLTRCPLKKGNFTVCNWSPDYSKFPPYIPGGKYKGEATFIYKLAEIAVIEGYVEVKPKNSWEMKK